MQQLSLFELRHEQYFPARGLASDMWCWSVFRWDGIYVGVSYYFKAVNNATR